MDVSIVILTKDAERYIENSLNSIFNQNTDYNFEIVCIDSGSTDRTEQICKDKGVKLYKILPEDFNHGLTRNLAVSIAKGEYIVFISQDAIPSDTNWLRIMVDILKGDTRVAGVYCRQVPHENASHFAAWQIDNYLPKETQINQIEQKEIYERLPPEEKYRLCKFDNACSCIRRSVWQEFNFRKMGFGEDIEWAKRVLEAGYKIIYTKEVAVIHSHDLSLIETFRRAYLHHRLLYNLFHLRAFPSFLSFLKNLIAFPLLAISFYMKKENSMLMRVIKLPQIAALSVLSVLGQYCGSLFKH